MSFTRLQSGRRVLGCRRRVGQDVERVSGGVDPPLTLRVQRLPHTLDKERLLAESTPVALLEAAFAERDVTSPLIEGWVDTLDLKLPVAPERAVKRMHDASRGALSRPLLSACVTTHSRCQRKQIG